MTLENKLGIIDSAQLAKEEERISKKKAAEMFKTGYLDSLEVGTVDSLIKIHKYLFEEGIDYSYYYEGYTTSKTEEL